MKKESSDYKIGTWIRTCQECGNVQKDTEPKDYSNLSSAYCERKCKHCKSEGSFDLGSYLYPLSNEEENYDS